MSTRVNLSAVAAAITIAACAIVLPGHRAVAAEAQSASTRSADSDQRNRQFQRAEALYLSGRLKEAAASFEQLTRTYPSDARIWLKYGNTLTKLGNYDAAAAAFQSAASLDPTQGGALINLSLVRLAQAQSSLDGALTRLQESTPEHAQALSLQRQLQTLLAPPEQVAKAN